MTANFDLFFTVHWERFDRFDVVILSSLLDCEPVQMVLNFTSGFLLFVQLVYWLQEFSLHGRSYVFFQIVLST
jgi:hypothetical protein